MQVAQTCRELAREADADVVWCTLFLRRFGSDFWGEATPGPIPTPYAQTPTPTSDPLTTVLHARTHTRTHARTHARTH
jgi:hypothetical protein